MTTQRRIRVAGGFILLFGFVAAGKLFSMSVLQHEEYKALAAKHQQVVRELQPRRGTVFFQDASRAGVVVAAQSVERFSVTADPRLVDEVGDLEATIELFHALSGTPKEELREKLTRRLSDGPQKGQLVRYMPPVASGLTKVQVEAFAQQLWEALTADRTKPKPVPVNFDPRQGGVISYLGGIQFLRSYSRIYPESSLAGPLLGFVNSEGLGQYGVEAYYDEQLKGSETKVRFERDSRGTALRQLSMVEGSDGTTYELTIDRSVQAEVERVLATWQEKSAAKRLSVVLMEVGTGALRALASSPGFDPNTFSTVANPTVFQHGAVSGAYEPGSVVKPLSMAVALDLGVVKADTRNTFGREVVIDGYRVGNALDRAYGDQTMTDVLVNSDNVAMAWLSEQLGAERLGDGLRAQGFGSRTNIDVVGEAQGILSDPKRWSKIQRANVSFGQGMTATPIQLATAYAALAGDGTLPTPHVVEALIRGDERQPFSLLPGRRAVSGTTAATVQTMLGEIFRRKYPTLVPGYLVGGKTGTAQVPDGNGGYLTDAANHTVAMTLPAEKPRFVLIVTVEQPDLTKVGRFAEATAVPIAGEISRFVLPYYQVPPR